MSEQAASHAPDVSLRARKQAESRARIELAAVREVFDHDYDSVSVERICELADVSQRTFFNHFGSKENAVLGVEVPQIGDDVLAAFVADDRTDVLDAAFGLATHFGSFGAQTDELISMRRSILQNNPRLMATIFARIDALQRSVTDAVATKIARIDDSSPSDPEVLERARLIITIAGAALRHTTETWVFGDEQVDLIAGLRRTRDQIERIVVDRDPRSL